MNRSKAKKKTANTSVVAFQTLAHSTRRPSVAPMSPAKTLSKTDFIIKPTRKLKIVSSNCCPVRDFSDIALSEVMAFSGPPPDDNRGMSPIIAFQCQLAAIMLVSGLTVLPECP